MNLRILRDEIVSTERASRNMVLFVLVIPLESLNPKECQSKYHRQKQKNYKKFASAHLRGANPKRHRQATADEDGCIDRAQPEIDTTAAKSELVVIPVAIDQVRAEHAAEEHNFGAKEQPHAER